MKNIEIIDVEYLTNYQLQLAFNDGFEGIVDLTQIINTDPFKSLKQKFIHFSLTFEGNLEWDDNLILEAGYLRSIAQENNTGRTYLDPSNTLQILTQAFQESLTENDPTIFQAALKGYVEKIGMSKITETAGIKSRASAYKSLSSDHSPKWDTIVKLAHSIMEIEQKNI
jgi:DNA-binding phage protein